MSGQRSSLSSEVPIVRQRTPSIFVDDSSAVKTDAEKEWVIGSRYTIRHVMTLRESPELDSPQKHELDQGASVLLLVRRNTQRSSGQPVLRGLVQDTEGRSGWCSFATSSGDKLLEKLSSRDSWQVGGRYNIMHPLTLRAEAELGSVFIRELTSGQELLLLEFGIAVRENGEPCLRCKVHTRDGEVGWVSCQTPDCKHHLLSPVDLYDWDPKDLARSNLTKQMTPAATRTNGARPSFKSAVTREWGSSPWELGGMYRILEEVTMRVGPDLDSYKSRNLKPGEKVTVKELREMHRPSGEQVMRTRVECDDGCVGWVSAEDRWGNCLLDVRDHLEFEKVQRRMSLESLGADKVANEKLKKTSQMGGQSTNSGPAPPMAEAPPGNGPRGGPKEVFSPPPRTGPEPHAENSFGQPPWKEASASPPDSSMRANVLDRYKNYALERANINETPKCPGSSISSSLPSTELPASPGSLDEEDSGEDENPDAQDASPTTGSQKLKKKKIITRKRPSVKGKASKKEGSLEAPEEQAEPVQTSIDVGSPEGAAASPAPDLAPAEGEEAMLKGEAKKKVPKRKSIAKKKPKPKAAGEAKDGVDPEVDPNAFPEVDPDGFDVVED